MRKTPFYFIQCDVSISDSKACQQILHTMAQIKNEYFFFYTVTINDDFNLSY